LSNSSIVDRRSASGIRTAAIVSAGATVLWLLLANGSLAQYRPGMTRTLPLVASGVLFIGADSAIRKRIPVHYYFTVLIQLPMISALIAMFGVVLFSVLHSTADPFLVVAIVFGSLWCYVVGFCCGLCHALFRGPSKDRDRHSGDCHACGYRIDNIKGPKCPECATRFK
jgi:hypothetical protein